MMLCACSETKSAHDFLGNNLGGLDASDADLQAALDQFRDGLFEPAITTHGGTIIKRMGDGWIVEFGNVADAVASAVDVEPSPDDAARLGRVSAPGGSNSDADLRPGGGEACRSGAG